MRYRKKSVSDDCEDEFVKSKDGIGRSKLTEVKERTFGERL